MHDCFGCIFKSQVIFRLFEVPNVCYVLSMPSYQRVQNVCRILQSVEQFSCRRVFFCTICIPPCLLSRDGFLNITVSPDNLHVTTLDTLHCPSPIGLIFLHLKITFIFLPCTIVALQIATSWCSNCKGSKSKSYHTLACLCV